MVTTNTSLIRNICNPENVEAWTEFIATYAGMVRCYVAGKGQRIGAPLGDADLDDVVQTVWIKLWKGSAGFNFDKERGRFRTYLYTVTMNTLVDFIRRKRKHRYTEGDLEQLDVHDDRVQSDREWDLAYRRAAWDRLVGDLRIELMRTSPAKWTSFEEYKLKGRSAKEVADEQGIDVGLVYQNASSVMQEARKRCQAIYEEALG